MMSDQQNENEDEPFEGIKVVKKSRRMNHPDIIPLDNSTANFQEQYSSNIGLETFRLSPEPNRELVDYVNKRYTSIESFLEKLSIENVILKVAVDCNRLQGTMTNNDYLPKDSLQSLMKLDHNSKVCSDILDIVGSVLNIHSCQNNIIPELVIVDVWSVNRILAGNIEPETHFALLNLRLIVCKIAALTLLLSNHYMLVVMLPKQSKVYVLSCDKKRHNYGHIKVYYLTK